MAAHDEQFWCELAQKRAARLQERGIDPARFLDEMRAWAFKVAVDIAPAMVPASDVVPLLAALQAEITRLDDEHAAQWFASRGIETR